MSGAVFGSMDTLEPESGTFSFLILFAACVSIESMFHLLHSYTHETAYNEILNAIEKELMVAGCLAFICKMLFNSGLFDNENWYSAIEFADLATPLTSFVYCIMGVLLMFDSIKRHRVWSRAYNLTSVELLGEFLAKTDPWRDW